MRSKLPLALAGVMVVPLALSSSGDSLATFRSRMQTETRAFVSSLRQVTADPITTGGVGVLNASGVLVWAAVPINSTAPGVAPLSGGMLWGSSSGIDSATGLKGVVGVADDNAGVLEVLNSSSTTAFQLHGNYGLRTVAGDLAEAFPSPAAEPGSVMAIDPAQPGALALAHQPYDRRVAGVVAGAKDYKPGVTLRGLAEIQGVTVTLSGTTYCLASDVNGPVRAGDLLTTSSIPGHAMRASDLDRARGAILGKAMEDLKGSRGHVLILASLQ